ncbi:hypothetical protein O181_001819 [Austropuccinia psidii MF-1]|uniref:Uncharacterized protein n=1 Tax=Austropuccinia psidii MF-1 TaxID=1389203 RepID=A0A9Q3BB97_9BASI|nr:hypothetical protein [Austropuccinia psidii MF-1]
MCQLSRNCTSWLQGALSADFSNHYWPPVGNQMIHSESAIFLHFQTAHSTPGTLDKGSLRHVLNTMSLGQVPTELCFECKEKAISSLPLAKDISIPENLKQALVGPHHTHWE